MNSEMLRIFSKVLIPLQYLLSVYLLLRGHNFPGGGFIGGLVFGSAITLGLLAGVGNYGVRLISRCSMECVALGLALAVSSSLVSQIFDLTFFEAVWGPSIYIPIVGKVLIGTPLFFDLGVMLVVVGVTVEVMSVLSRGVGK